MRTKWFIYSLSLLVSILAFPTASFGLMSSANYTIFADSIDAGGSFSSGGAYILEDTVGEFGVGDSAAFKLDIIAGYQAMESGILEVNFDTTNVNLGNLIVGAVASSSVRITVTTTAPQGYVVQLNGTNGSPIQAVSDGSVTAGQEEYGIAVVGPDAAFAEDRGVEQGSNYNLAASSTAVYGVTTEVIFKASITNATVAGNRSNLLNVVIGGVF